MCDLIDKLRKLMKECGADALLVNSTNEFLVEYNELSENSRYHLTGFSGSTGDALLTRSKLYQFVDGRYHEQADLEVDKNITTVVKLKPGKSYLAELTKRVPKNSKLLTVASKNSNYFEQILAKYLAEIDSKIMHLDFDPVAKFTDSKNSQKGKIVSVPIEISGESAENKLKRISSNLNKDDVIISTSLEDVSYLSNLRSFSTPYSSSVQAKAVINNGNMVLYSDSNLANVCTNHKCKPLKSFEPDIKNLNNLNVYINDKTISAYDYSLINSSNTIKPSDLYALKTTKNDAEINHMKDAFSKTDKALLVIEEMINSDKKYSELDFYNELDKSFYKNGAKALSFKPIVAAGKNSSIIHYSHPKNDVYVEDGDLLLVDCGGYYSGGYATDMTRTFVKGKPSKKQQKVYTTVLKAFLNAYFHKYSAGKTWFDIDKIARNTIDKENNPGFEFSHSTGHGVGICVHEAPPIVAKSELSKFKIEPNVTFTIEPGIYKKNWGGVRLENTVLSVSDGSNMFFETLSKYKFEDKLIDTSMLNKKELNWLEYWQNEVV